MHQLIDPSIKFNVEIELWVALIFEIIAMCIRKYPKLWLVKTVMQMNGLAKNYLQFISLVLTLSNSCLEFKFKKAGKYYFGT